MDENLLEELGLKPLKVVKCTDADCENDLHCFLKTKKLAKEGREGECRYCGISKVDWERVHKCDINDVDYTFSAMRHEFIRHHFWHNDLDMDIKAINYARRKGKKGMREAAENRIRKSVAPESPFRDGTQTPFEGNVLYYAQHATASCCRKCIEEWHAIPRGRALTEKEVEYLTALVRLYVEKRLPNLNEEGERVPPIRKKDNK